MSIKVTNNFPAFEKEVKKKAVRFVNAVMSVGASQSRMFAPIAYGTLVNSQKTSVSFEGNKISGTLGYYVDYAYYLETRENWEPKAPPKYGNKKKGIPKAMAWNANAKPHFLRDGFEDPKSQAKIERLQSIFKF